MKKVIKRDGTETIYDFEKITKAVKKRADETISKQLLDTINVYSRDNMTTDEIQNNIIRTAVEAIDVDKPQLAFVAAGLQLDALYHNIGKKLNYIKGNPYGGFKKYLEYGIEQGRIYPQILDGFDIEDLENHIQPERDNLFNYLGIKTLLDRYLLKDLKGEIFELPQYMFMGIAMILSSCEDNKQQSAKDFYDVISKFEVMLATPTLSNARTNRHQLSSCYLGSSPDNIEGIFSSFKEMGILSKFGGGIGWDWTAIRALAGPIDNNVKAAGGLIPQLKITNDIALAFDQLGVRKGAIATYLEPWSLDIISFLDLKKNSGEERFRAHDIFPALWINDLFMERVDNDDYWTLFDSYDVNDLHTLYGEQFNTKYKEYELKDGIRKEKILAKDLWRKILTSYRETGTPFLTFKDRANLVNPNDHKGIIRSSNLCTEIFQNSKPNHYKIKLTTDNSEEVILLEEEDNVEVMSIYSNNNYLLNNKTVIKKAKKVTSLDKVIGYETSGNITTLVKPFYVATNEKQEIDGETAVCNLASLNMSKIKTKEDLARVIPVAVRMLDNVITLNYYPLSKIRKTNLKYRGIGLGVMGEAELLASNQIMYGSSEHEVFINKYFEAFSYYTIKASMELAKEKGAYPVFKGSKWSKGIFPHEITTKTFKDTFDFADEINLDWEELRKEVMTNGMRNGYLMAQAPTSSISILVGTTQSVEPIYKRKWSEENSSGLIPTVVPNLNPDTWNYYISAYDLEQEKIVRTAAIRLRWFDQGGSTNLFYKTNIAGKVISDNYRLAHKLGMKSTYYLRSQSPEAISKEVEENKIIECSGCQ